MSHYVCQRCKLPLILDESLEGLSNAQAHLLTINYGGKPVSQLMGNETRDERSSHTGDRPIIPAERMKLFEDAFNSRTDKQQAKKAGLEGEEGSFVILDGKKNTNHSSGRTRVHVDDEEDTDKDDEEDKEDLTHQTTTKTVEKTNLADTVNFLSNIFSILCSKYEIDYPVCSDCAGSLIDELKLRFEQLSKEKDTYVQFLKKLTIQSSPNVNKANESLNEIEKLKQEERDLLQSLKEKEKESEALYNELYETEKELESLVLEEEKCNLMRNEYELEISNYINERDRLQALYEHNLTELDTLRRANVYNDTFLISHDGQFGTINGLRLGMLDSVEVSWFEINAALGQFVLLLSTVISRLNFTLDSYKLIPLGSNSKIEKYQTDPRDLTKVKKVVYDCFSNGETSFVSFFTHNKLDGGMLALVDVVSEIGKKLKKLDPSNDLPYQMTKDKVAGYSIKPSAKSSNEEWTAACRYLLTNAKWILAYCSVHSPA